MRIGERARRASVRMLPLGKRFRLHLPARPGSAGLSRRGGNDFTIVAITAADGKGLTQNVENRAVGVDGCDQAGDVRGGRGAFDVHGERDILESSRDIGNTEESAQIETAFGPDRDRIERDVEDSGVGRVNDFLAGA